jgi:hypothetical protein
MAFAAMRPGKKGKRGAIPGMGHAMSGTQLGQVDSTIQNAQAGLAKFASGGEVKKPAGPSAKERREIRDMIERGKDDAIATLRNTRSALASTSPPAPEDYTQSLDALSEKLAMKDGGEVESAQAGAPTKLYEQYTKLMDHLHTVDDPQMQMQLVDQLTQIVSALESMGISVPSGGDTPG